MRNISVSFLGALAAWAIRVLAVLLLLALPVAFVRALGVLIAFRKRSRPSLSFSAWRHQI